MAKNKKENEGVLTVETIEKAMKKVQEQSLSDNFEMWLSPRQQVELQKIREEWNREERLKKLRKTPLGKIFYGND